MEPTTAAPPEPSAEPTVEPAAAAPYRLRWLALVAVLGAEIMDLVDSTIVGIASPVIRHSIGGTTAQLQWFSAAYTLAFAMFLITGARLGDIFGRRRLFLIGAVAFTSASMMCGLAQSPGMLIAFRAIQGTAAALLVPQGFGMLRETFPEKELPIVFAVFGPVMGLAAVGGPLLGGYLAGADLLGTGWRSVFWVNVPLGITALVVGALTLPRKHPHADGERRPSLDLVGVLLVSAASVLLILPLVQGRESGWPAWTFVCMGASVPILAGFGWYQKYRARQGRSPLIEPSLFRRRSFTSSLGVGLGMWGAMIGFMLTFSLYTQLGLGWSPEHTAYAMVPWSLGTAVGAGLAGGLLVAKFGRRVLHGGLLVAIVGILGIWLTVDKADHVTGWLLTPATAVMGLGFGLLIAPFFDIAIGGVETHELGSASGTLNAMQQFAGTLGVAVLGTVLFNRIGGHLPHDPVYGTAFRAVLLIAAGALAVAWLLTFLMPMKAREDAPAH